MAGDKFNAKVYGWYNPTGTNTSTYSGATAIVTSLINAITGGLVSAGSKGTSTELSDPSGVLNSPLTSFTNSQPYNSSQPKAYLNWMVLDAEQFKLVTGSYGAVQIPAITGTMQKQLLQSNGGTDITVTQNGYLYVYVSNESQGSVYFDDLRIEHTKGPIQEETHYYPFGLTMAGISDKAAGGLENKYKYNGKELQHNEFSDGGGLEEYDYGARMQDPQLGIWHNTDPLTEKYFGYSPYNYCMNNPIALVDPNGMDVPKYDELEKIFYNKIGTVEDYQRTAEKERQKNQKGRNNSSTEKHENDKKSGSGLTDKYKVTKDGAEIIERNNDKHDDFYDGQGNLLFSINSDPKSTGATLSTVDGVIQLLLFESHVTEDPKLALEILDRANEVGWDVSRTLLAAIRGGASYNKYKNAEEVLGLISPWMDAFNENVIAGKQRDMIGLVGQRVDFVSKVYTVITGRSLQDDILKKVKPQSSSKIDEPNPLHPSLFIPL
jgi:RHS repeat-associated protein